MSTVAVIGASRNADRPSNSACHRLVMAGHVVYAVSPTGVDVHGGIGVASLADIPVPVDTVSIYVSAEQHAGFLDDIIRIRPRRVIFNPGTESEDSEKALVNSGIHVVRSCSLVLLSTQTF